MHAHADAAVRTLNCYSQYNKILFIFVRLPRFSHLQNKFEMFEEAEGKNERLIHTYMLFKTKSPTDLRVERAV
jgi:hypothetical protein